MKGFIQASFDNERSFLKSGSRVGVPEPGTETNWGVTAMDVHSGASHTTVAMLKPSINKHAY